MPIDCNKECFLRHCITLLKLKMKFPDIDIIEVVDFNIRYTNWVVDEESKKIDFIRDTPRSVGAMRCLRETINILNMRQILKPYVLGKYTLNWSFCMKFIISNLSLFNNLEERAEFLKRVAKLIKNFNKESFVNNLK